jgi:diguanylate cyclase (GGDEF)-like protein/PAS domain S-box-containing protein
VIIGMPHPSTTRTLANLTAGLTLLVIVGLASMFLVIQAQRAAEWATHAQLVVDDLTTVRRLNRDVELAERAWRITGERAELAPVARALAEVTDRLDRLHQLTVDDPALRARLVTIRDLVARRFAAARALEGTGGPRGQAVATGNLHLDLDSRLVAAVDLESRLLTERRSQARLQATLASWFVPMAFAVGLAIVTVALVRARRDVEQREQLLHRLAELAAIVEHSADGMCVIDGDGRVRHPNHAAAAVLRSSVHDLTGLPFLDTVAGSERAATGALISRVRSGTSEAAAVLHLVVPDGEILDVQATLSPIRRDTGAAVDGVVVIFRDMTTQWRAERELQRAHNSLIASMDEAEHRTAEIAKLTELSELLQSCISVDDACKVIARVMGELLPADTGAVSVLGPSKSLLETVSTFGEARALAIFGAEDCWALRRGRLHRVDDNDGSLACHHHEGPSVAGTLCMPLMAHGETLGIVSVRPRADVPATQPIDVRQRLLTAAAQQIAVAIANLRLRESLRQQSIRDPLTGLFNRRFLEESLGREVRRAERHNSQVSVLMLDVDHFKRFNDTWGHEAGDLVLREIGAVLDQSVRDGDVACRFGGEEFAIVMPDAPFEIALLRAEQLRMRVKAIAIAYRDQALGAVAVSVGVASYRLHGLDGEHVLRSADEALYLAKQAGRDRVAGANQPSGIGPVAPLPPLRAVPPRAELRPAQALSESPSLPM